MVSEYVCGCSGSYYLHVGVGVSACVMGVKGGEKKVHTKGNNLFSDCRNDIR